MKQLVKKLFHYLPFTITKNQRYDAQTRRVIRKVCRPDSNCIDVGCHRGEIMDLMLQTAPRGTHYGFEPIPALVQGLQEKYAGNKHCVISDIALSSEKGVASFNYVVSNPSYSGLRKRKYDRQHEQDTVITVQTDLMDDVLPPDLKVDLIKIDVEGAEEMVLAGAVKTMQRCRPVIIFEYGLGASDVYGSTPERLFRFFADKQYGISLLCQYLDGKKPFSQADFEAQYFNRTNHYFIAYPIS